jgi:alkylresorcinol/alkylpyrone synthase
MAQLLSLGTAFPPHRLMQDDVIGVIEKAQSRRLPNRIAEILRNSGIAQRYLAKPPDYYFGPRSWEERARVYAEAGEALFRQSCERALDRAGLSAGDIGQIIFVSTTGTMTPSLPSNMIEAMGFAADCRTVPLFGYGCAGGVLGLALANDLYRARPDKPVLLVCLELCSLAYDQAQMDKKVMVALALFADGCAAAVVGAT